jgi:hypothetical protein
MHPPQPREDTSGSYSQGAPSGGTRHAKAFRPRKRLGWIAGALEGAVVGGGVGVFAAALTSIGIPQDSIVMYEIRIRRSRQVIGG